MQENMMGEFEPKERSGCIIISLIILFVSIFIFSLGYFLQSVMDTKYVKTVSPASGLLLGGFIGIIISLITFVYSIFNFFYIHILNKKSKIYYDKLQKIEKDTSIIIYHVNFLKNLKKICPDHSFYKIYEKYDELSKWKIEYVINIINNLGGIENIPYSKLYDILNDTEYLTQEIIETRKKIEHEKWAKFILKK